MFGCDSEFGVKILILSLFCDTQTLDYFEMLLSVTFKRFVKIYSDSILKILAESGNSHIHNEGVFWA